MSKCAFFDCDKEHQGSKQFNDKFIRVYLCAGCLIRVANLSSEHDGGKFIEILKKSKKEVGNR